MYFALSGNFINNVKMDALVCGSLVLPCKKGVYPILEDSAMRLPITLEMSSIEQGIEAIVPYPLERLGAWRLILFRSPHPRAKLTRVKGGLILMTADYLTTVLAMATPFCELEFSYRGRTNLVAYENTWRLTCRSPT